MANREVDQRHKRECNHFFYGREGGRKEEFKKKGNIKLIWKEDYSKKKGLGWLGWYYKLKELHVQRCAMVHSSKL